MTRDYAKSSASRKKPKKKVSYFILWLLVLLLFTLLTFGLVYFGKHKQHLRSTTQTPTKTTLPVKQQPTAVITKEISTPKFDFYTILPQKSNNTTVAEYELEVTTVKNYIAADQLKAELTLLGFTVSITPTRKNGVQQYQVSIGPYDNKDGATADLEKLKQNKIGGKIKRIK